MTISVCLFFELLSFLFFSSRGIRILREICIGSDGNALIYSCYFVLQLVRYR